MFARIPAAALAVLSVSILAVANPAPGNNPPPATTTVTVTATAPHPTITSPSGTCTSGTGPTNCCAATTQADSPTGSLILGLLGILVQGVDVLLGIGCSPITVIGIGNGDCSGGTVVCCEDNNVGGVINIGCIPIVL